MVSHRCPICGLTHQVREARAELAYGRQLTCSPECESERRCRMRHRRAGSLVAAERERPASRWQKLQASVAHVLHVWVIARAQADLVLATGRIPGDRSRRG